MGYSDYLRNLLKPLGIYDLSDSSLSGSELDAIGLGLDSVNARIDYIEREGSLSTAESEGLDRREALFARAPVHYSTALRRAAIAALLRIGLDSFTLDAINDTIAGCGIKALAQEKDRFGYIRVIFPEVAGIPPEFDQISKIILDIIPCHLDVEFYFRYLTWAECHAFGYTWDIIHENQWTWHEFELAV